MTYRRYKLLIDIYLTNFNRRFTARELSKLTNIHFNSPLFREIISVLREKEILIKVEQFGKLFIYNLNYEKLAKLVRETEMFVKTGKFIEKNKALYSY